MHSKRRRYCRQRPFGDAIVGIVDRLVPAAAFKAVGGQADLSSVGSIPIYSRHFFFPYFFSLSDGPSEISMRSLFDTPIFCEA